MESILIKDTTRQEREQIVAESIGNIGGACDGGSESVYILDVDAGIPDDLKDLLEGAGFIAHFCGDDFGLGDHDAVGQHFFGLCDV